MDVDECYKKIKNSNSPLFIKSIVDKYKNRSQLVEGLKIKSLEDNSNIYFILEDLYDKKFSCIIL